MQVTDDRLLNYILVHSTPEDALLAELNRETFLKVLNPRMLSGHLQGKLLEFISYMISPMFILEIGTYTGYSAICLASGLKAGGKLITVELNDEIVPMPKRFIKEAGMEDKIEIMVGNALDIIPSLNLTFDLVFIDADKTEYINYFEMVIEKVNSGGFIIADNVLWSGKVLENILPTDKDTKGIIEFNKHILNDPRIENLILPLRDGLSLIRKY